MRSFAAAARRAERDAQRRQRYAQREQVRLGREISRMEKQVAKQAMLDQARAEVEEYEERLALLNDIHRTCGDTWDWHEVLNAPAPVAPPPSRDFETAALTRLNQYTPTFFERLFRKAEKHRAELEARVVKGRKNDENVNAGAQRKHLADIRGWEEQRDLAAHILEGDLEAYREAVDGLSPFNEMTEIGCEVDFAFHDHTSIDVSVRVDGDQIVPGEVKGLLASGKLSVKKMPKGRFYELYQDYVCGSALRVAREIFALLPLETALVTVSTQMLNPQTGRQEQAALLSVIIPRRTLETLSFGSLDPSDAMRNFSHRMGFKRSVGFTGVEPLTLEPSPGADQPPESDRSVEID